MGWDYQDNLIRSSLLASLSRLTYASDKKDPDLKRLRALASLVPAQQQSAQKQTNQGTTSWRDILRAEREDKTKVEARAARLTQLSTREIQHAIRTASHNDLQSVRGEAGSILGFAFSAIANGEDFASTQGLPGLLFDLLMTFGIGAFYKKIRPMTFEDIPKNLSLVIGWRLVERDAMKKS